MTRHQLWRARERARFRHMSEVARLERYGYTEENMLREWTADADYRGAQAIATCNGIPEPFYG